MKPPVKYIVKVGFWYVAADKERSELFHIRKSPNKDIAEKKALEQAVNKFGKLVKGVEPFFVEQTNEIIDGKVVVFETETSVDVAVPGNQMFDAIKALNLHKVGRDITMEDNSTTFCEAAWRDLQESHYAVRRTQSIPIVLKVTEDGQLHISVRKDT